MVRPNSHPAELAKVSCYAHGVEQGVYCTECIENILHFKDIWSMEAVDCTPHRNINELVVCGKQCRLCSYICSLFQQWQIDKVVAWSQESSQTEVKSNHPDSQPPSLLSHRGVNIYRGRGHGHGLPVSYEDRSNCWLIRVQMYYDQMNYYEAEFTIYTNAGNSFKRAIWSCNAPVSFEARIATAREWLSECQAQHQWCRKTVSGNTPAAARILRLRLSQKTLSVDLVPTNGLDLYKEEYLVLSHVWGGIEIDCKTTSQNLMQYQDIGIEYNQLPRTFQEAITITAALSFRYLWIDSLCIVQDDIRDWEREAVKMAAIYRGATLTLSATSACNSRDGPTLSRSVLEPALQFPSVDERFLAFAVRAESRERMNPENAMLRGPTNSRAWILQEKVLSQRILHITDTQMVWQCSSITESEDGMFYKDQDGYSSGDCTWALLDTPNARMPTNDDYRHFERYWRWVANYMRRDLSNPSDQYAAFAGIVNHFQRLSDNEPLLGLWREHLHLHLAWHCNIFHHDVTLLPEHPVRRPSWTWMTFPHNAVRIMPPSAIDYTEPPVVVYKAELLQTRISWSGEPLTSKPSGTITLSSICDEIKYSREDPGPPYRNWSFEGRSFTRPNWDPPYRLRATTATEGAALTLLALNTLRRSEQLLETSWLIIEATGSLEDCEYMRVGLVEELTKIPGDWVAPYTPHGLWREITLV